jgi:hypothetical protein
MFINTKAFFPMDFILQNGLPVYQISLRVVNERENQHLIGSLLLRLHDSIVSLPVLMLAVAAAMVLAGRRTRLSVRNHPEFCDPKTMAKGMDPK